MTQCTADFDAGTNGNAIATTDPGSATAWDVRNLSTVGCLTYSNAHSVSGSLSGKFGKAADASANWLQWTTSMGTITDHYGRAYVWIDAWDAARHQLIYFRTAASAAACGIWINSTGTLSIMNNVNSAVGTTSATISVGQWVRLEWHFVHSTTVGMGELKLFNTASSSTATETVTTAANKNFAANAQEFWVGWPGAPGTTGNVFYVDSLIVGAASYPGPIAVAPANTVAPVASGTATVGLDLSCTTGTWTGTPTPTYTYQWKRDGVSIGGQTASTHTIVSADQGTTLTCTVTATNTAGAVSATSNGIAVAAAVSSTGPIVNPGLAPYLVYTGRV